MSRICGTTGLAALCAALVLAPALWAANAQADQGDSAIAARKGFMQVVVWEAGPLFGMARGDIPYDADAASAHAAKLQTIVRYPWPELFLSGTSNADRGDKTRALPSIWEDRAKFEASFDELRSAADALVPEAGKGHAELGAAVQAIGRSCGNCHEAFRQKN